MFNLFKKKKKNQEPFLLDLDENVLVAGDKVEAFRYDLGICTLVIEEDKFFYISDSNNEKISYLKMIDASTERQKVRKIEAN